MIPSLAKVKQYARAASSLANDLKARSLSKRTASAEFEWTLTFGDVVIPSNWDIPEGKILEINSYPWTRRCVDSDGINRRANLIGATPYLDRLKFKDTDAPKVSLTATGTNGNSKGVVAYRDAFQVIK